MSNRWIVFVSCTVLAAATAACAADVSGSSDEAVVVRPLETSGEGGVGAVTQRAPTYCVFTCTVENGVEVCRGSGPECNGKTPIIWQ